jgi:hypothetical protein
MLTTEFDAFQKLLDQLSVTWTGFAAKDELVTAYWEALRDVRLSEVQGNVQRILRTATGKSPFPKPAELRNEVPKEANAAARAAFEDAERRGVANLEELRKEDPDRWKREVQLRKADRILATEHPSSPIYAQALREWHSLRARQ